MHYPVERIDDPQRMPVVHKCSNPHSHLLHGTVVSAKIMVLLLVKLNYNVKISKFIRIFEQFKNSTLVL